MWQQLHCVLKIIIFNILWHATMRFCCIEKSAPLEHRKVKLAPLGTSLSRCKLLECFWIRLHWGRPLSSLFEQTRLHSAQLSQLFGLAGGRAAKMVLSGATTLSFTIALQKPVGDRITDTMSMFNAVYGGNIWQCAFTITALQCNTQTLYIHRHAAFSLSFSNWLYYFQVLSHACQLHRKRNLRNSFFKTDKNGHRILVSRSLNITVFFISL